MQLAEFPWAIVVFLGVALLLGGRRKTPPQASRRQESPHEPAPSLFGELGRALEQLKRAEAEARRAPQHDVSPRLVQDDAGRAKAYLEQRKQTLKGKARIERKAMVPREQPARPSRAMVSRSAMPLVDDDADKSSEAVSLVTRDYDDDGQQIVAARLSAVDRGARPAGDSEALSATQAARRSARPAVAIGGAAEHTQWHQGQAADAQTGRSSVQAPRRGVLARFANGSLRGALVLSEVLGPPVGER
jgi:hypothetical protein